MEDKLQDYFSENDFDFNEPHAGHLERFEKRLSEKKSSKKTSWKWLSVAASVVLIIGFWLGSNHQKKQFDLADVSPKMEEVQNYFVATIHQELKEVEKHRNLKTEAIIELALEKLEDLEDNYKILLKELSTNNNQKRIIYAMVSNYQQRLEVLENILTHIEKTKNTQQTTYENTII